jgi:Flp pilus assembly protein TadG
MKDRSRAFGRFVRGREGAAAVEFALVIGPLLFILGCIIEIGLMLFAEYTLQDGVQDAGRLIRTNTPTNSTPVRQEICNSTPTLADCVNLIGTSVQVAANYSNLTAPTLFQVDARADVYQIAAPNNAVILMATYDWDFIFPGLNVLSNVVPFGDFRRLQGIAVFQVEPP